MIKTAYYLKDAKASGATLLYASCTLPTGRHKIYIPFEPSPKQWDPAKQQFRKNFPSYSEANALLERLSAKLASHGITQLSKGQPIVLDQVRELISVFFGKAPVSKSGQSFLQHYQDWIDHCATIKAESTVSHYKTGKQYLIDFAKAKPCRLDFENMTLGLYEAFVKYLIEVKKLCNNTVGGYIAHLKTYLTWAYKSGFNDRKDYQDWKVLKYETEIMYLTRAELDAMEQLDLSSNYRVDQARDIFLFACDTGLRFSDILKLMPEDVRGDVLHVRTKKTEDFLRIPLSPMAKRILSKYAGGVRALPVRCNTTMNKHLKTVAKLAKLVDQVTTFKKHGNNTVYTTKKKQEALGVHTARRTFVTLSLEAGLRPEVVMKITGHKDYATMKRYLKLTDNVVQVEMQRIWDAKQPLMKAV